VSLGLGIAATQLGELEPGDVETSLHLLAAPRTPLDAVEGSGRHCLGRIKQEVRRVVFRGGGFSLPLPTAAVDPRQ
jgi:hypothetical protein